MNQPSHPYVRIIRMLSVVVAGLLLVCLTILFSRRANASIYAAPIDPPAGYPKLSLSTKVVSPMLVHRLGETLFYEIEIINTGAYPASGVVLTDLIPENTAYNGDATASVSPAPVYSNGILSWTGEVGFDSSVLVKFSVDVDAEYEGVISNTAAIDHPLIPEPVTVMAEAMVTDQSIFNIQKTSSPARPGPNKPLTYSLEVTNIGQPAVNLPVKVTDPVPASTSVGEVGQGGTVSSGVVIWNDQVNLDTGASTVFTFTVNVGDVASGTILTNRNYQVNDVVTGEVYTTTVVDPILFISKSTFPDPPGSNGEMTYTLSVLNKGSLATDLVVTDRLPAGVTYRRGGNFTGSQVSWILPSLDTDEAAQFTYTVYVGDVAGVNILNDQYRVESAEGISKDGELLNSLILGPSFEANLWLDPIAKKPGGGNAPVTPTMVLRNEGPGNALDATALMYFRRISVQGSDLVQTPPNGQFSEGPECGDKCVSYRWVGDLAAGETITFTTLEGQNSVGGEQGTHYTATLVITDQLGTYVTDIYSASVYGLVTHFANLIPGKTAPPVIGASEVLSYVIEIFNSGLSTTVPPYPVLTDTIPTYTTFQNASDGGALSVVNGRPVVSWILPALSTGERIYRSFNVLVDSDLVSGTQIINQDYRVQWQEPITGGLSISTTLGVPVTTTVKEVGLIDSFKTVTPTLVRPGPENYLTYTLHVVNSSSTPLHDVQLDDIFPWEHSTYQRDAITTAGEIVSDIVSLSWLGDVGPFATELITFSVLVDEDFEGPIINTATITHPSLLNPVDVSAVAYVTNKPVLKIQKTDDPDPVPLGEEILYTIGVNNLGQQATNLVVTDTIPANTTYVAGSATGGGTLTGNLLRWEFTVLAPGESRSFSFRVKVLKGPQIVNHVYGVSCSEGISALGVPVVTDIFQFLRYLPITIRR